MEVSPSSAATRKVGVIVKDGFDGDLLEALRTALQAKGAIPLVVCPHLGSVKNSKGGAVKPEMALYSCDSVLFDALCVLSVADEATVLRFMEDTFRHCKPIAMHKSVLPLAASSTSALGSAAKAAAAGNAPKGVAVFDSQTVDAFVKMVGERRVWEREASVLP